MMNETKLSNAELQRKSLYKPETPTEDINKYYQEAISHFHLKSMLRYGRILLNNSEEKQKEEGISLIKKAAEKGNIKANYFYGINIEEKEKEINLKESESLKYFKKVADEGHVESMNKVGIKLYKYNISLPKLGKFDESIQYLNKACIKGCLQSMYQYGYILINYEIPPKMKEGTRLFKISADLGYADSMGEYATSLKEEAIKYFKTEISNNNSDAMLLYGKILLDKNESIYNKEEGIAYIKKAADSDKMLASYEYGRLLEEIKSNDKKMKLLNIMKKLLKRDIEKQLNV